VAIAVSTLDHTWFAVIPRLSAQTFVTPKGEAQNVRFEQRENGIVHIYYDLVSSHPRAVFSVKLEASQDGGTTFGVQPQSVTGDASNGITPGMGKRIVWDSGKDVERVRIDQFRFRIVATAGPLETRPSDLARTTTGGLTIRTDPAGAHVVIDGTPRGVTPLELGDLASGEHRVSVTKAGFLENSRLVQVQPGGNEIVIVTLTALVTQPVTPEASGKSGGGSRAKWLIPLVAGGGVAAVLGTRGGGGTPATSAAPTSPTAAPCSFVVSPSSFTLPATGGSAERVTVSTSSACSWTATSNSSFVAIVDRSSFVGNDTVVFSLEPNTNPSNRIGTLTVAGQTITVTQAAGGPDRLTLAGLTPPSGSTVRAGSEATAGVAATVSYFLGSRDSARICVFAVLANNASLGQSLSLTATRGSGTVIVHFIVLPSEPSLPVTTTQVRMNFTETACSNTFLSVLSPATFTWTRP
jgi:hypothetical protein